MQRDVSPLAICPGLVAQVPWVLWLIWRGLPPLQTPLLLGGLATIIALGVGWAVTGPSSVRLEYQVIVFLAHALTVPILTSLVYFALRPPADLAGLVSGAIVALSFGPAVAMISTIPGLMAVQTRRPLENLLLAGTGMLVLQLIALGAIERDAATATLAVALALVPALVLGLVRRWKGGEPPLSFL